MPTFLKCLLFIPTAFLVGCGGGGNTTTVSGTVTFKGKKVNSGSLTFLPQSTQDETAGKPAAGVVKEDGSFQIEGVFVGKNKVTYTSSGSDPSKELTLKPGESAPKAPYDGLSPKTDQIEITSGAAEFQIELVDGR